MTKRAPPAGRKRASNVWVLVNERGSPGRVWWGRFGARIEAKARGMGERVVRATLTWTEPRRRRP